MVVDRQVSQVDHESVQATALKIVFDLVHLFGFEAYATHDDQGGDSEDGVVSCVVTTLARPFVRFLYVLHSCYAVLHRSCLNKDGL